MLRARAGLSEIWGADDVVGRTGGTILSGTARHRASERCGTGSELASVKIESCGIKYRIVSVLMLLLVYEHMTGSTNPGQGTIE